MMVRKATERSWARITWVLGQFSADLPLLTSGGQTQSFVSTDAQSRSSNNERGLQISLADQSKISMDGFSMLLLCLTVCLLDMLRAGG